jgi:hypothetical protein
VFRYLSLLAALALPASAGMISGVTIYSVSSEYTVAPWDLSAIHVVDGSGLSGTPLGHAVTTQSGNSWQTITQSGTGDIQFDLGAVYGLSTLHVWNLNFYAPYNGRGANHVTIRTSSNAADWNTAGTYQFTEATGLSGDLGFDIDASNWQAARYVDFQILDNFAGDDNAGHVGLSEVRFFSSDDVPEPSSLILLGLGISVVGLRGARRRD